MQYTIKLWKFAPFLRLLIPFIIGLCVQYYFALPIVFWLIVLAFATIIYGIYKLMNISKQFFWNWLTGTAANAAFIAFGGIILFINDGKNDPLSIKNKYREQQSVVVTIQEPLTETNKSYKANASVAAIGTNSTLQPVTGNIILYFSKENGKPNVEYGSQIVFKKQMQSIKNSGNPACFDYVKYCEYQKIYYQVFLKAGDYSILKEKSAEKIKQFLFATRISVTNILQQYITGRKELGLAEALLIGYKQDLDKDLVQAYTNTGVVHIIAISGLHLAVIYWLLTVLLKPLGKNGASRFVKPLIIIAFLWLFSLLSGASPSVMRSVVMFTCIVLGETFSKQSNIYNTLSISAFLLLCYNPFWLWDVGFQLSYAAVLSIVIFMKPIYHCLTLQNKLLDNIWQTTAVTISAQILTTPISLYYFHQFPIFFLLTNLLAVPISSVVLIGEILLCAVSFIKPVAVIVGKIVTFFTWFMDGIIERINSISFSTWQGLQITVLQNILLYVFIIAIALWLMQQHKRYLFAGLITFLAFISLRTHSFYKASIQQKLIVYNVPQMQAIDIVQGRKYQFVGDKELLQDAFLQNFHLMPSRIWHRVTCDSMKCNNNNVVEFSNKKVLIIDTKEKFAPQMQKLNADVIIISHNPRLYIDDILQAFTCNTLVFDSSNPDWKTQKWKKDCERLGQKYYVVKEQGAFVLEL